VDEPILRIDREISLTGWIALRPYREDYSWCSIVFGSGAVGFGFLAVKFDDPLLGVFGGMLLTLAIWFCAVIVKTLKRYRTPVLLRRTFTPDGLETSMTGMESKIVWSQIRLRSQTGKAVVLEIRQTRVRIQLEKSDYSEAELAAILHWQDAGNRRVAPAVLFK
jgi:hypothetical protein